MRKKNRAESLFPIWTTYCAIVLGMIMNGCIEAKHPYSKLAPGIWRATLQLDSGEELLNKAKKEYFFYDKISFDEKTEGELPFLFEIAYLEDDSLVCYILNGEERILVSDIAFGRSIKTARDTLRIDFALWDTHIEAVVDEGIMEGSWVVDYKENYAIPFVAKHGQSYRFSNLAKAPVMDVSGSWATTFWEDSINSYIGLAELRQSKNKLSGTIRTETGDYRYLDGNILDDKLYLSTFDGTHAFLFEGKIQADSSIIGIFRSGQHYISSWEAKRTDKDILSDPLELTSVPEGHDKTVDFEFRNTEGELVRLSTDYAAQPLVLQIMGTWCPNCLDETHFFKEYINKNPETEVQFLGLAFERYPEETKSLETLRRYKERLDIPYELLLAGTSTNKKDATRTLPFLDALRSYPTTLFLDREHKIVKIHTGFNGPATDKYEAYKNEFDKTVTTLVKKK